MNRQFGALRGLAMLIVVLNHSIETGLRVEQFGYPLPQGVTYYVLLVLHELGIFAVPTFLFISGAFFSYAARGSDTLKLPWKVVWASLKHLMWPYLVWSIIFYVVIFIVRGEVYSPAGYLKNLLTGFPYHFVPILAFYYLVSPFLVTLAKRFSSLLIVAIAVYQLFLINIVFPGALGFTFPAWTRLLVPPVLGYTLALWAIYFPLGLVYSINTTGWLPRLQQFKWLFLVLTLTFFSLSALDTAKLIDFRLAGFIAAASLVLFIPTLKRNSIPKVRELEEVGKRSYGLYLTHLVVLELVFLAIAAVLPGLLNYQLLLQPLLFGLGLAIPLLVMNWLTKLPATRLAYRYVFG